MSSPSTQPVCPLPRASTACENCRSKKLKCVPSNVAGVCRRCLATSSNCGPAVMRPKRTHRQSPANIAPKRTFQLEASDDILDTALKCIDKPKPELGNPILLQDVHRSVLDTAFPDDDALTGDGMSPASASFGRPKPLEKPKRLPKIDPNEAERMLRRYESLNHQFPFVVLPRSWNLSTLLIERPFLTISIFSAMASTNLTLQRRLATSFRTALIERLVINGERSLDLLQGLLVHLAWFPLHMNPRHTQLYQTLQIAVTMASEMGYDTPLAPITNIDLEIKRACLGCYYLSSIHTLPPKRLSSLPFSATLDRFVVELAGAQHYGMDTLCVELVSLHLISEEAFLELYEIPRASPPAWDTLQTGYKVLSGVSLPMQGKQVLGLVQKFAEMRTATLQVTRKTTRESLSEALETAAATTRSAFEAFIGIDEQLYQHFSTVEWTRLIHVVINVFRLLSVALAHPTEDRVVEVLARFATYFEMLTMLMKDFTPYNEDSTEDPNMFLLFNSVLPVVGVKFGKMISKLTALNDALKVPISGPPRSLASLCPVVNGSINTTEYWQAFTNADTEAFDWGASLENDSWLTGLGEFEGFFSSTEAGHNDGNHP